jgi:phosphinothricin acetyltransferase
VTQSAFELRIRDAVDDDLPRIVEIYNESIPGGWSTADTRPVTVESRKAWFADRDPARRPIWVAEAREDASAPTEIAAWVSLTSFYRGRPAYDATAEISVYVGSRWQRRGIGRTLKRAMIERCPSLGVTTLVSMHFDHNAATQRLNDELGFVRAGHLEEIAVVDGHKRGLVLSLLRVPPKESESAE